MSVFVVQLGGRTEKIERNDGVYALSLAIKLYHEYEEENPIVIASPSPEAAAYRGSAFFSIVYRSPVTDRIAFSYSNVPFGYSLMRLGVEALVITGRFRHLTGLYISGSGIAETETNPELASDAWAATIMKSPSDPYIAIGPAGEHGVVFSSLQSAEHDIPSDGLGYLFGQKNLKGIAAQSFTRSESYSDSKAVLRTMRKLEKSRIVRDFRLEGSSMIIDDALRLRWIPCNGYSSGFDPRAYFLDGKAMADKFGIFPKSCQDCLFSCGRMADDGKLLPGYSECIMLGTNLGFFSPESVMALSREARSWGLDTSYLGALLSYLSAGKEDYTIPHPEKGNLEDHIRVIRIIAQGYNSLSKGLRTFPEAVQDGYHRPITSDLRADYPSALASSLCLDEPLIAKVLPSKPLGYGSAAVFFLYEKVISYALLSKGYAPFSASVLLWSHLHKVLYRFPMAIRLLSWSASIYGMNSYSMLSEGYRILNELEGEARQLPDSFLFDAADDGRTVPYTRLLSAYRSEKLRLEMVLKFRSDKRRIPFSSRRAAVGPEEDLGRDGDPGLQK